VVTLISARQADGQVKATAERLRRVGKFMDGFLIYGVMLAQRAGDSSTFLFGSSAPLALDLRNRFR
jgi:hypothetical protein